MNDDDLIEVRRNDLREVLRADSDDYGLPSDLHARLDAALNAPVSPSVPITRLREWIEGTEFCAQADIDRLTALLDEHEHPTRNEETP